MFPSCSWKNILSNGPYYEILSTVAEYFARIIQTKHYLLQNHLYQGPKSKNELNRHILETEYHLFLISQPIQKYRTICSKSWISWISRSCCRGNASSFKLIMGKLSAIVGQSCNYFFKAIFWLNLQLFFLKRCSIYLEDFNLIKFD